jgi:splicing factor 3B subunit 4
MAAAGIAGGRITVGAGTNLLGQQAADRNQDATVYVGNLDLQVTEEILFEIFVQAGLAYFGGLLAAALCHFVAQP